MLKKIVDGRWLTANGVVALLPANTVNDDDIEVYTDDTRSGVAFTWYGLRQQGVKPVVDGVQRPNQCLSDFIAPKSSGIADYIGMFAVTAGLGADKIEKRFEDAGDDYSAIMVKALADRLAEAFAEYMHERVRTDLWGYEPLEALSNEQLIKEAYVGIRPAPGYPACPEHTVKADMFEALQAEEIGMARRCRASTSRTRSRSISWSERSGRTRWTTWRRAVVCRKRMSSVTSPRICK
jgi:5-methyltetrahydrofolate--homocysteine methyltransferase